MDVAGHCAVYAYITCASPEVARCTASKLNSTIIAAGFKLKVYHATDTNYDQFVPSNWSQYHKCIVISQLRSMTIEERYTFTSSLHTKISLLNDEIMFVGKQKDIVTSQDMVKNKFLTNLQCQVFPYQCLDNSECKHQIENFVLVPALSHKLQFEYFVKDSGKGQLDITIFSQTPADFTSICNCMQVS